MNKETEYWEARCKAAEQLMSTDYYSVGDNSPYDIWRKLVNTPVPQSDNQLLEKFEQLKSQLTALKGELEAIPQSDNQWPTDDDISLYAFENYHQIDDYPSILTDGCFYDGAKWMRDYLKQSPVKESLTTDWDELWKEFTIAFPAKGEYYMRKGEKVYLVEIIFNWFKQQLTDKI